MPPVVLKVYKFRKTGEKTRIIGMLYSDLVFRKDVVPCLHQLNTPPAWCIDKKVLDDLVRRHCKSIHLADKENRVVWIISPEYFQKNMLSPISRAYGIQAACPLKWWQSVDFPGITPKKIETPLQAKQLKLV